MQRLVSVSRRRRFDRNEVVFHRDDPADSLHLIEKGRVAVRVSTPLGDTVTIAVRGPGWSFGEMALVGASRRTATVAALDQTETLAVYKDDFEQLRREHPSVDRLLFAFLVGEVRLLEERLLEALYLPVERRVLRRLRRADRDRRTISSRSRCRSPRKNSPSSPAPPAPRSTASCATKPNEERSNSNAAAQSCSTGKKSHAGRDRSGSQADRRSMTRPLSASREESLGPEKRKAPFPGLLSGRRDSNSGPSSPPA